MTLIFSTTQYAFVVLFTVNVYDYILSFPDEVNIKHHDTIECFISCNYEGPVYVEMEFFSRYCSVTYLKHLS